MLAENTESFLNFLDKSQTFLGVLATIAILFIIQNENSNAVLSILKEVKLKFKNLIKDLEKKKQDFYTKIIQSKKYELLNDFIDSKDNGSETESLRDELYYKVLAFIFHTKALENQYNADFWSKANDDNVIESISKSKEIVLAPLYTLLFCIVVFVFDEAFRLVSIPFSYILFSVLSYFLFLSVFFWSIIWTKFFRRFIYFDKEQGKSSRFGTAIDLIRKNFSRVLGRRLIINLIRSFIILLSVLICLFICLFVGLEINCVLAVTLSIALPVFLLTLLMLCKDRNNKGYTYLFICGHFAAILFISFLQIALFYLIAYVTKTSDVILITFMSITWLKVFIFAFVILNGIVFPVTNPYMAYWLFFQKRHKQKRTKTKIQHLKTEMENLAKEVTKFQRKKKKKVKAP